jgi:tetratricopeptide (TPR) repeat protein
MAGMSDKLDRFARGKLPPAESRELAQQAIDDHDLFDKLTSTAVTQRGFAARARKQITWPRAAILATAAAVLMGVALYGPQPNAERVTQVVAISRPPVLLARNGDSNAAVFRGADAGSRDSRVTGSIGSIAGGVASIDLGSLDGLAKDAEVNVVRGGQVIGPIKLTTIFRDHSRGEIPSGASIHVNDQVSVPPAARLRAVLDQIAATLARGEADKAMSIAQKASLESFDAELSSQDDLNNAGVVAELHGDRGKAGELYRRALQTNPPGQDRQAIEANLARLEGAK